MNFTQACKYNTTDSFKGKITIVLKFKLMKIIFSLSGDFQQADFIKVSCKGKIKK